MYQAQTHFSSVNVSSHSTAFLVPIYFLPAARLCLFFAGAHLLHVAALDGHIDFWWWPGWCRQRFPETTQVTVNNTRLGLVARAVNEHSQSFPLMGKTPTREFLLLKKENTKHWL